jgi:predicted phosphodiesterase
MTRRSEPGSGYPVLACASVISPGARSATLDGAPLALPAADPKRILVIGDTGCRMKGTKVQACNDAAAWPFHLVAAAASVERPDLVIHVGDYHYRETACPAGNQGCAGSPFGDNWAVWKADFFSPAAALLRAAPWVAIRGNHEECNRGGRGWSRILDAYPFDTTKLCNDPGEAFNVALPGLNLFVMDVSTAEEETVDAGQAARFRSQFQAVAQNSGPSWLLLHRPIWSVEEIKGTEQVGANKTLGAAATGAIPTQVQVMLSGHHHTFQVFNYEQDLPPQLVSGHGGDYLDPGAAANPAGMVMNGVRVRSGVNLPNGFGFTMMERQGGGTWRIIDHDMRGNSVRTCKLVNREVTCGSDF